MANVLTLVEYCRVNDPVSKKVENNYISLRVFLTCERPRYMDTVSEIYRNLPSAANANANPSNDWKQNQMKQWLVITLIQEIMYKI